MAASGGRRQWPRSRGLSGAGRRDGLLCRQVAAIFRRLRQEQTARNVEVQLNQLLARAHEIVYSGRKTQVRRYLELFPRRLSAIFRQLLPFTAASLGLFLAGALLGSVLTLARPGIRAPPARAFHDRHD